MSESISIAFEVYFLGFLIAFGMACLIKLIMVIIHRGDKAAVEAEGKAEAIESSQAAKANSEATKTHSGEGGAV